MNSVILLGSDEVRGTYVLRTQVPKDISVSFGRFQHGDPIPIPAGDLIYVGSAMARSGSMTLACRTLRHATRRPPKPPHQIRPQLIAALRSSGLAPVGIRPPASKKLFWNVDYLLDEKDLELVQIFLLRSARRLEDEVAQMLTADPACHPIAPGLGAHDRPGSTHLLHVRADGQWWSILKERLVELL